MTKIQFVLCDDNTDDLETLCESVNEYMTHRSLAGETVCFSSAADLLHFSENNDESTIAVYLLDIIMPAVDGIKLGKRIREHDNSSAVIYISSSKEYALDAFEIHAFSYLVKPLSREKLFFELDGCLSRIGDAPQSFSIKTANGLVSLALSEIIAVEYLAHRLIFHKTNGERVEAVCRKQSFDVQAEEFAKTGVFLKVSTSYLVNCRNIRGIKADEFVMCDGSQYKITRKYIAARQQYINSEMSNK